MGEFDDGFEDDGKSLPYRMTTMFQVGHSDGYTHRYGGPLYGTYDAAVVTGRAQHGNYAVEPKSHPCIVLDDGRVFIVEGPYKTIDEVEIERELRQKLLAKLSPYERKLLGVRE